MTLLVVACIGLVLLSGLFYLFPRYREQDRPADERGANLEWYRLREAELASEDNAELAEDAPLPHLGNTDQCSLCFVTLPTPCTEMRNSCLLAGEVAA